MGQKIAFATRHNDNLGVSNEDREGAIERSNSFFSGLPFAIMFAKKWSGQFSTTPGVPPWYPEYYPPEDAEYYPPTIPNFFPIEPGWLEVSNGVDAPFPEVSLPSNPPSGVILSKIFRPLLLPGFSHLGPFSRSEITRLWWTMRELAVTDFSTSAATTASISGVSISGSDFGGKIQSDKAVNMPTEMSKINGFGHVFAAFSSSTVASNSDARDPDEGYTCENKEPEPDPVTGEVPPTPYCTFIYAKVEAEASINFAMIDSIFCDIDSPEDFYIGFYLNGSLSCSSLVSENYVPVTYPWKHTSGYLQAEDMRYFGNIDMNQEINRPLGSRASSQITSPIYRAPFTNPSPTSFMFQQCLQYPCGSKAFLEGCDWVSAPPGSACGAKTHPESYVDFPYDADAITARYVLPVIKTIPFHYFNGTKDIKILMSEDKRTARGDFTAEASISDLNFSIRVREYHEYDDGNGNPIYNKDTGAILRDPATGAPV